MRTNRRRTIYVRGFWNAFYDGKQFHIWLNQLHLDTTLHFTKNVKDHIMKTIVEIMEFQNDLASCVCVPFLCMVLSAPNRNRLCLDNHILSHGWPDLRVHRIRDGG